MLKPVISLRITNEVNFSNGELEMYPALFKILAAGLEFWLMDAGVLAVQTIFSKKALRDSLSRGNSSSKITC